MAIGMDNIGIFDITVFCRRCGQIRVVPYSFGDVDKEEPEGYSYGRSYLGADYEQAGRLAAYMCECAEVKEAA